MNYICTSFNPATVLFSYFGDPDSFWGLLTIENRRGKNAVIAGTDLVPNGYHKTFKVTKTSTGIQQQPKKKIRFYLLILTSDFTKLEFTYF